MKKVVAVLVVALLVVAAYFVWDYLSMEARHREEVRVLNAMIQRLSAERRVAQVVGKERTTDAEGNTVTKLEFLEWDRDGKRLPPVFAAVPGTEVYFDALVIKFDSEYVEKGDVLRGKTIILFTRIFGSHQKPVDGVPIDPGSSDGIPSVYRVDAKPSAYELDLWKHFWSYADNPKKARELGVRVLQGEAVHRPIDPNCVYDLSVEAAGGINIKPSTPEPTR